MKKAFTHVFSIPAPRNTTHVPASVDTHTHSPVPTLRHPHMHLTNEILKTRSRYNQPTGQYHSFRTSWTPADCVSLRGSALWANSLCNSQSNLTLLIFWFCEILRTAFTWSSPLYSEDLLVSLVHCRRVTNVVLNWLTPTNQYIKNRK